ncbi:hypothetical protein BCEP4_1640012 [Burkholderia cepacia]|nr:hypothetical protein BCEP4_1640012 [Burkholderia cepacia]
MAGARGLMQVKDLSDPATQRADRRGHLMKGRVRA